MRGAASLTKVSPDIIKSDFMLAALLGLDAATHRHRKLHGIRSNLWVAMPCSFSGLRYRRIMRFSLYERIIRELIVDALLSEFGCKPDLVRRLLGSRCPPLQGALVLEVEPRSCCLRSLTLFRMLGERFRVPGS